MRTSQRPEWATSLPHCPPKWYTYENFAPEWGAPMRISPERDHNVDFTLAEWKSYENYITHGSAHLFALLYADIGPQ